MLHIDEEKYPAIRGKTSWIVARCSETSAIVKLNYWHYELWLAGHKIAEWSFLLHNHQSMIPLAQEALYSVVEEPTDFSQPCYYVTYDCALTQVTNSDVTAQLTFDALCYHNTTRKVMLYLATAGRQTVLAEVNRA
jgi:hypothetical protein